MDTQGSVRVSTSPSWGYFWAGVLLACTFGIVVAATVEAFQRQDAGWSLFFLIASAATIAVYWWIVLCWVNWNFDRSAEYRFVCTEVCCSGEGHHDPSEPGEPGPFGPPC